MATLIYVHGTGVRGASYTKSLDLITEKARTHVGHAVVGVPWGDEVGATLRCHGASIPDYRRTGGTSFTGPHPANRMDDLWLKLLEDPLSELRTLAVAAQAWQGLGAPPGDQLRAAVDRLGHSSGLAPLLAVDGREAQFLRAKSRVVASPEFAAALQTMGPGSTEHPCAVAMAIVAYMEPVDDTEPEMSDTERDQLFAEVVNDLGGEVLGVAADFLKSAVVYAGSWVADPILTHRRGRMTDQATPAAADILAYTLDGSAARAMIADRVAQAPGPVYLLGHSLGGIMCLDLLCMEKIDVDGLITVGSQAPYLYEVGALRGLTHPESLRETFPRWLNLYDDKDVLSYVAAPIFGHRVSDHWVDNGKRFPAAHRAYWENSQVWEAIRVFLQ